MLEIDETNKKITITHSGQKSTLDLYSDEGFEILSKLWIKSGWNQKYTYNFTWLGRPVIQLPCDLIRLQEAFFEIQPDFIIETGVAHGGSLIFYASLCKLLGKGRVIGVDVDIRKHNKEAIEAHFLSPLIDLIIGDSVAKTTLQQVETKLTPQSKIMVVLDSCHTKDHVLKELEVYSKFVTKNSYLIIADGVMQDLYDVPRGAPDWKKNNPVTAVEEFLIKNPQFVPVTPPKPFSESTLQNEITYFPNGWLKRVRD